MNFHAVGAQLERGVRRLATMLRTPTLGEQVRNLHSAYCHSQSQFTEAAAVLRAVRADLNAYHKADDDRISVAVIRIDMWADGKPGADKCPMNAVAVKDRVAKLRADRDALGLKRLELYAHPDDWPAIKALAAQLVVAREYAGPATSRLTFELSGALCSHQDPNNCNRERDCPAFVALPFGSLGSSARAQLSEPRAQSTMSLPCASPVVGETKCTRLNTTDITVQLPVAALPIPSSKTPIRSHLWLPD